VLVCELPDGALLVADVLGEPPDADPPEDVLPDDEPSETVPDPEPEPLDVGGAAVMPGMIVLDSADTDVAFVDVR